MKTYLILALFTATAGLSSCAPGQAIQIPKSVTDAVNANRPLTETEVASGLKEALSIGISKGATTASQPNGYYQNTQIRIPFPPEVKKVESTLRAIGMGSQVDNFVLSLNRAAEDAAQSAKPIFLGAIRKLTIKDVWGILTGGKDAATQYLKRTTSEELKVAFTPKIQASLDKVNATKYYSDVMGAYNNIPLVQKVNPDLTGYATQKAIDGLFLLVAQEEANIRENPIARTTDLLRRVFSKQ
jgi:LysM repeat protein